MNQVETLIIGAGISGLVTGGVLQGNKQGSLQILDKGRSPGGRLATRRIGQGTFDHGAQFITTKSDSFIELAGHWQTKGWIQPWFVEHHTRYMATGGMSQLAKKLAHPLPIAYNYEVNRVYSDGECYIAEGINTATSEHFALRAQSLVMTCPLPQALKLLDAGNYPIADEQSTLLKSVTYSPCLAILLQLDQGKSLPSGHLREPVSGVISWMADNHQKGISPAGAWTIHMDATWSERHYKDSDDEIMQLVLPYIQEAAGFAIPIIDAQVKRWRYAQAHHLLPHAFLDIGIHGPLLLAGDAFAGDSEQHTSSSKVEHAVLSGLQAGLYLS